MRSLYLVAWVSVGACSFSGNPGARGDADPPGDGSVDGADATAIDAPVDAVPDAFVADARACFGTGFGAVCLTSVPTQPLALSASASFDTGGAACTEVVTLGTVEMCVLAGTTVTLPAATTFRATGSRPLVIVATDALIIDGTINVSSRRGGGIGAGAGTPSALCTNSTQGEDDLGGGGGGAGGSFGGRGGDGGIGDTNGTNSGAGGTAGNAVVPTAIRAGCPGARGGNAMNDSGQNTPGGLGSPGGGAVYLIAGTAITISGSVVAGGMGGSLGATRAGGGGAGSGGLIGLDAPAVAVSGTVAANGGGAGEGGGFMNGGNGADATSSATRAPGGQINTNGGDGGAGSAGAGLDGLIGGNSDGGGGGGGGGAGYIYVKGTLSNGGTISPSAAVTP